MGGDLTTIMQRQVVVVAKVYAGKDKDGDFKGMVKQKQYNDTLFLIAENYSTSCSMTPWLVVAQLPYV